MVLSKMNNHEHRSKQTYESYTFQLLMSFWLNLIAAGAVFRFLHLIVKDISAIRKCKILGWQRVIQNDINS